MKEKEYELIIHGHDNGGVVAVFTKIIGHVGHFRLLGSNV